MTTNEIHDFLHRDDHPAEFQLGRRAIRSVLTDLETIGLIETWIESKGRNGRQKQIETMFEPHWVHDAMDDYVNDSTYLTTLFDL